MLWVASKPIQLEVLFGNNQDVLIYIVLIWWFFMATLLHTFAEVSKATPSNYKCYSQYLLVVSSLSIFKMVNNVVNVFFLHMRDLKLRPAEKITQYNHWHTFQKVKQIQWLLFSLPDRVLWKYNFVKLNCGFFWWFPSTLLIYLRIFWYNTEAVNL